ncbi:hypothetical protein SpCBS45565_g03746 [Spizellomyces sp. 'palustris']|nr:hypothetical protein SpCBS45565_g03746 [Spizellomyces sp. 'palustris']
MTIPTLEYTAVDQIEKIVEAVRQGYSTDVTKSLKWRKQQLRQLHKMIDENEDILCQAAYLDKKQAAGEAFLVDLMVLKNEIVDALENLDKWVKPERVHAGLVHALDRCEIRREPFGVALIIGAWNYAYQLTLGPFMAAIAAGNAAVIKPSEVAPFSAAVMTLLIEKYLDPNCVRVVNGGVPETTRLLELQFDHIFYTGNGMVGKIVMAAASKHLTPVVLELGGKSPVIIDDTVDPQVVAKRIMWAKSVNCGQTCIAPDYVLATPNVLPKFVSACSTALNELYGEKLRSSKDYPRIVAERHFDRLSGLLSEQLKIPGSKVAVGGFCDRNELFIEPTVVTGVGKDEDTNPLMKDEIFGPILPVIEIKNIEEGIQYVRSRDKPLALYVFSKSDKTISTVLSKTDSGNTIVNDLFMNMAVGELPFGGVGPSGMGKYHGHHGFLAYTHPRSTMIRPAGLEKLVSVRYPPLAYSATGRKIVGMLLEKKLRGPVAQTVMSFLKKLPWNLVWWMACVAVGVVIGYFGRGRG